eukprot:m.172039 g.172039  ORF g.172039 m.172039 type:complete len:163 (-) comp14569_c0_seq2:2436-2924(-)
MAEEGDLLADISTKLISIPTVCPTCSADVTGVVMHVDMPEFAGKLLNQVKCPYCGFVKTDVVSKDIMTDMGRKFTLKLCAESSWKTRNIMKSSTATVTIPEVGLEGATTAGGTFTTVEELLLNIREEVSSTVTPSLCSFHFPFHRLVSRIFFCRYDYQYAFV